MTGRVPPNELLASDSYWAAAPSKTPSSPFLVEFCDEFVDRRAHMVPSNIATIYTKMLAGCDAEPINPGMELPLLDTCDYAILKVVTDRRKIVDSVPRRARKNAVSADAFNELSEEIIRSEIYKGVGALALVEQDEQGRSVVIGRGAAYYRTARSGQQLSGIASNELGNRTQSGYNLIMAPKTVGTVYGRDKDTHVVARAEILTPADYQRRPAKAKATAKRISALGRFLQPAPSLG